MDEQIKSNLTGGTLELSVEQLMKITKKSEDFFTIYCNQARFAISFADIRMIFGQNSINPDGTVEAQEDLCIVVSPEFAQIVLQSLSQTIRIFEERIGKIRPRPDQPLPAVAKAIAPKAAAKKR